MGSDTYLVGPRGPCLRSSNADKILTAVGWRQEVEKVQARRKAKQALLTEVESEEPALPAPRISSSSRLAAPSMLAPTVREGASRSSRGSASSGVSTTKATGKQAQAARPAAAGMLVDDTGDTMGVEDKSSIGGRVRRPQLEIEISAILAGAKPGRTTGPVRNLDHQLCGCRQYTHPAELLRLHAWS